jgi:hypothetical protein
MLIMPRNKKKSKSTNSYNTETYEKQELSEAECWDVIEFAKNMSPMYNNIFTPDMVNQRMQDVNMNPMAATQDAIEKALLNPKNSEQELIGFSQFFELNDMIYKRMLYYLGNMLSFDLTYTCINATPKDYKSVKYKKDIEEVHKFLDKFNHKQEFKKVLRNLVRQEVYFSVFRDDGDKYLLQELPQKHCKLTGRWDYGFLFDFDMYWFVQPSVNIDMYPKYFKQLYLNWMEQKNNGYDPASSLDKRDGSFVYWTQTSPEKGVWAWKFNPDVVSKVPFLSPLYSDIVLKPLIRKLQTNIYFLQAQKVMVGLIPLIKESKSGSIRDNLQISPEVMGKFLGLMKQGLNDAIKVSGVPFSDVKTLDFDGTDKKILEDYTKSTTSMSGVNSRLIYSVDKQSNIESQLSINVDEQIVQYTYSYFEDFLNYHINKRTKYFKFKFSFEGTEFDTNKKKRLEDALTLADKGIVLPQKISAAIGMNYHDMCRHLEEAQATGFTDKLMPLINIYNQTGDKDSVGRKKKADTELSESGQETRDVGSNLDKGGDI